MNSISKWIRHETKMFKKGIFYFHSPDRYYDPSINMGRNQRNRRKQPKRSLMIGECV